ncbi:hypothetical protein Acor_04690 [Acrocarpospora corrugata]|uniref:Uncharacterized protein n=1 Tax=Acrocarpospora corrugata TaxID=35763 RepID=A0A5M3VVH5_9ACTN|nr:hypothetical protein [Acrocarpospora corrugata]GER98407.1 hypothetical protein Acor_04690 [Acrocarpospora corrugata]
MSEQEDSDHIAMWGAPGSGKTTLLAALSFALLQRRGPWRLVGTDPASIEILRDKSAALARREFPPATIDIERFRWLLLGDPVQLQKRFAGRFNGKARTMPAPRVGLNLIDPPGGVYTDKERPADHAKLLENLQRSRGIVYLFDPIREFEDGNAFEYLHGALIQLASRMLAEDAPSDGRLPHYLAVCITKFDDRRVLETAEKLNLVTTDPDDPHGFPAVDDENAQTLFHNLCDISASGSAEFVMGALEQYFRPDRIKFFVTSSIGFYLKPGTRGFNPRDYQNMVRKPQDGTNGREPSTEFEIRGQARPINVREPVTWLAEQIYADQLKPGNGR